MHVENPILSGVNNIPFDPKLHESADLSQAGIHCIHVASSETYRIVEWADYPKMFFLLCPNCVRNVTSGDAIISAPIRKGIVN